MRQRGTMEKTEINESEINGRKGRRKTTRTGCKER